MSIVETCPCCEKQAVFKQIHRTFTEKVVKRNFYKYRCTNCAAEIFSHRFRKEISLHRSGSLHLET